MNPLKIDYRIGCVAGMIIGVVLIVIAIATSHGKAHIGLAAWGVWAILCSVLLLISRSTDTTVQASDAEDGQTLGSAWAHVGTGVTLTTIGTAVVCAVVTVIFGI